MQSLENAFPVTGWHQRLCCAPRDIAEDVVSPLLERLHHQGWCRTKVYSKGKCKTPELQNFRCSGITHIRKLSLYYLCFECVYLALKG
jgi:hypothetical protein